jgi:hypothetical protein
MMSLVLMAALAGVGAGCWADDVNATGNNNDPVKHPINAYQNHEVKEDIKDSQENSQKAAEAKATYKQAKADYQKSLKANGAKSDVTVSAKKRMNEAHKEMRKYNKKTAEANRETRKDEIKAHQ